MWGPKNWAQLDVGWFQSFDVMLMPFLEAKFDPSLDAEHQAIEAEPADAPWDAQWWYRNIQRLGNLWGGSQGFPENIQASTTSREWVFRIFRFCIQSFHWSQGEVLEQVMRGYDMFGHQIPTVGPHVLMDMGFLRIVVVSPMCRQTMYHIVGYAALIRIVSCCIHVSPNQNPHF